LHFTKKREIHDEDPKDICPEMIKMAKFRPTLGCWMLVLVYSVSDEDDDDRRQSPRDRSKRIYGLQSDM
jgi:hypothetical protein